MTKRRAIFFRYLDRWYDNFVIRRIDFYQKDNRKSGRDAVKLYYYIHNPPGRKLVETLNRVREEVATYYNVDIQMVRQTRKDGKH